MYGDNDGRGRTNSIERHSLSKNEPYLVPSIPIEIFSIILAIEIAEKRGINIWKKLKILA